MSPATAKAAGVSDGDKATVATAAGSVTLPVHIVAMTDGVVWLPTNSAGSAVRADLVAGHGSRVTLRRAE
jgi:NADH-quinone oxidoreductase subunit G